MIHSTGVKAEVRDSEKCVFELIRRASWTWKSSDMPARMGRVWMDEEK